MIGKDAGFTLIEAMTVMAVVAVTLTLGLPVFGEALQRQRVGTALHLVSTDLAMARSSAIMGRSQVVVCPRTADLRCRGDYDWGAGWMVFRDDDGDRQPNRSSDILRASDAPTGGATAKLALRSTRRFLRYRSDGRTFGTNLSVLVCADGRLTGKVIVNNLGRVRSERLVRATTCVPG